MILPNFAKNCMKLRKFWAFFFSRDIISLHIGDCKSPIYTPYVHQMLNQRGKYVLPSYGNITISLLMNITMNQLGGASVIAKFHS